jgi:hypothetical protein
MAASIDLTGVIRSFSSPFTAWSKIKRSSSKYDTVRCSAATLITGDVAPTAAPEVERSVVRLGLPSKGRMSEQTLNLLKACLIIDSVAIFDSRCEIMLILFSLSVVCCISELPTYCQKAESQTVYG